MPKVDFYVLSEKHTPDQFVCQLVQKIWQQGHQVYIHTDHEEQASQLDTRLWTYSDISFLAASNLYQFQRDKRPC